MPFQYNKIYNKNKVLKIKMNFSNYIKLCTLALFITMGISRADASNESIFYDSYKLINEGKFEEAEKVLSNLQKLLPNNIEIFNNLVKKIVNTDTNFKGFLPQKCLPNMEIFTPETQKSCQRSRNL